MLSQLLLPRSQELEARHQRLVPYPQQTMSKPAVAGEGEVEAAGSHVISLLDFATVVIVAMSLQVPGAWTRAAAVADMKQKGCQSCTAGPVVAVAAAAVVVPGQQHRHLAAC